MPLPLRDNRRVTSRLLDHHRVAVEALLAPLAQDRAVETLPVSAARIAGAPDAYRHRVLAVDIVSPTDLPPFDNSQMDGYAVRAAELADAAPCRRSRRGTLRHLLSVSASQSPV